MASHTITPPNPSIFTSDPLEQIFAKDMFSPENKGGLAYMMLNAAEDRRDRSQGAYAGALDRANQQAMFLQRLEEAFKQRQEMAKLAAQLAPHGFLPSTMSGGSDVFNGNPAAADPVAQLQQDLVRAKIAHENASAAAAGRSGSGADTYTVKSTEFPASEGMIEITGKGRDVNTIGAKVETLAAQARERLRRGLPLTEEQKKAKREADARNAYHPNE